MERIDQLTEIVRREVKAYDGPAFKAKTYYFEDFKDQAFAVVIVPDYKYPTASKAGVTVMAHIVGDKVVIDQDITDRPLYEELIAAGIPRKQIILAYAGETLSVEKDKSE
ncbi:MAG: hypothetical protein GC179_13760 [Anaerolineaceae bacterium]|nr:hypothetical protein [Anaerolineaceae bacterium]